MEYLNEYLNKGLEYILAEAAELGEYVAAAAEPASWLFSRPVWFLWAQIFGVITIIFEFASYQIKVKSKYFLCTGVGSFFWMLMFFSIGMATGIGTQSSLLVASSYSTVRNLVFWRTFTLNTVKSKEFSLRFLLVMIVIAFLAGGSAVLSQPSEVLLWHIFGFIGAVSFVVGQYLPGIHAVRVTVTFYAAAVLLTQTPLNILEPVTVNLLGREFETRWNFMGIAIEAAKIISVIVFYIRVSKEPKKAVELVFAKP